MCVYLCILPDSHSFSQFHWSVCVSTIPHRQTDSHTLYNERVFAILSSYYHTTTLLQLEQQQTDRRKLSVSLPSLLHFTFLAAAVTLLFHLSINLIQFNFTFQWANRQTDSCVLVVCKLKKKKRRSKIWSVSQSARRENKEQNRA